MARNLDVTVYQRPRPATTARREFSNGTVKIQSYEPFRTDMRLAFSIDGGMVQLERIDLQSEGSSSVVDGVRRSRPLAGADSTT